MKIKMASVLLIVSLAVMFSACDEAISVENAYSFGYSENLSISGGNILTAMAAIEKYFEEIGAPMGHKIYKGTSDSDTDNQAKAEFKKAKDKIVKATLDTRLVYFTVTFDYTVSRDTGVLDRYSYTNK
ncbi:hypothetical protein AGMMS49546_03320 [Spirochaetia bacterium]|nr:hypothetical protein AGMMS49546_03320 [Spirochaetia bacterium]